jgi:predicted O-methyltransferase YrrM
MENRDKLAEYFKELGFMKGVEVGVERGYFSEILCKANPDLKLFCVDAWQVYDGYRDHTRQEKLERYYNETIERLKLYNVEILRGWSLDMAKNIPDNSLDFVYLDANHDFRHVIEDVDTWSRKVRKGGIVSGHDYNRYRSSIECQVKDAIDAWGHAYKLKINVTGEPDFPSWWYMK